MQNRIGHYLERSGVGTRPYQAYIPKPIPPDPPIVLEGILPLLDKANVALGRLDSVSTLLPDSQLFIYMYVRKEAVLSSQIEGTQSTLSDLLLHEDGQTPGVPVDDTVEVSCYVAAMEHGLERLKEMPLSLRLIREIHEKLMANARGGDKKPGEFRTSQNWIGGKWPQEARFVPPPPDKLMECLDPFEKFLHDDSVQLPILIKAALVHQQFETIHPFLDGNGRLGRLLITLLLCVEGVLGQPLLYLSLFLKDHREDYYYHLQNVRRTGDWESWLEFFLEGVIATSEQATSTAQRIADLFQKDRKRIEEAPSRGSSILQIYSILQRRPVASSQTISGLSNRSLPTVIRCLDRLEKMGIVRETTGNYRNRRFVYSEYIDLLNEGSEPPP